MFPTALAFTKRSALVPGSRRRWSQQQNLTFLARCGLLWWLLLLACFGVLQAQKAITFPLGTIPRQLIPSRLGFRFSRKAYLVLRWDLRSPWTVWTVIDFAFYSESTPYVMKALSHKRLWGFPISPSGTKTCLKRYETKTNLASVDRPWGSKMVRWARSKVLCIVR